MPLTAAARARYPADWALLSWTVLHRAGMRCECTGECGRTHDHLDPADGRCRNRHGEPRWRGRRWQRPVFLSAAHLDHDPAGDDPARIAAFCEGCHLGYDRAHHAVTRRQRRERELGLIGLFELAGQPCSLPHGVHSVPPIGADRPVRRRPRASAGESGHHPLRRHVQAHGAYLT